MTTKKLTRIVNDIIEELLDLDMDMEPKLESSLWTSTCKAEDERTLKVCCEGKSWDLQFVEVFDLLGYRLRRSGKGIQETEKTLRNRVGSWWRHGHTVLRRKCDSGQPHLQHRSEWECELALDHGMSDESETMGIQDPATDIQTKNESRRRLGGIQEENVG